MSENYHYILGLARSLAPRRDGPIRLLDYGCGGGQVVRMALEQGMDAYGVDAYEGSLGERNIKRLPDLWQKRIFGLDAGRIPFPDAEFDLVLSNQVFEHIDDFTLPLSEIARVMRPDATFIDIFPSLSVWREGHVGVAFSHWFPVGSRARYHYMYAMRALGLGLDKGDRSIADWTSYSCRFLDNYTFYKPYREIQSLFQRHFTVERRDGDYLRFRIERHRRLAAIAPIVRLGAARPFLDFAAARLAGHVFILRKRPA